MLHFSSRSLVLCGVALLCAGRAARADFALQADDRVVFYGDSITEQRRYTTFAETFLVTRFPHLPLSFVNSGWSGDRVSGGGGGPIDLRLQRDVLAYHPTVMTIMLGMNDGNYSPFNQNTLDTYAVGMQHILDTVQKADPGVRITLIQPSPYDDITQPPKFEGGYNAVLEHFSDFLQSTARYRNMGLADLNTPLVSTLKRANALDHDGAQDIIPDRIHPGPGGGLIMAEALLKTWNAPSLVTDVTIDAGANRVVGAKNTQVSALQSRQTPEGTTLSWTQNDGALPFPIPMDDPTVALAVKSSDFVDALDREPLKVTGLSAPRYTLTIDGEEVGDFGRDELAGGVNLATLPTPMLDQARDVQRLTLKHNDQHFERWRTVQVPFESHSVAVQNALPALLAALDGEEAQTVAQQRAAALPRPHLFQLSVAQPKPTGPDLALHKPYTSTDPNAYGYGTGGLTDGSWSGERPHTFASGENDAFPKATTIDLGATQKVSRVRLGVPAFGSTKTITVSLSADGQNFTEVASHVFLLAVERRHTYSFAPVSARYVRLTYPDHYQEEVGYHRNFVFTTEAEVYGPTG